MVDWIKESVAISIVNYLGFLHSICVNNADRFHIIAEDIIANDFHCKHFETRNGVAIALAFYDHLILIKVTLGESCLGLYHVLNVIFSNNLALVGHFIDFIVPIYIFSSV